MQPFLEAAEGIRTLDLLHGKQNVGDWGGPQRACKPRVLARARLAAAVEGHLMDGSEWSISGYELGGSWE
jgi:hypothetical protein